MELQVLDSSDFSSGILRDWFGDFRFLFRQGLANRIYRVNFDFDRT